MKTFFQPRLVDFTDEYVMRTVSELRTGYQLKRTMRYASTRDSTVHAESVAEHVFALLYLAHYFLPLEDPEGLLDVVDVHRLMLFHDFPEIAHGDVPYNLETAVTRGREQAAAPHVFAALPPLLAGDGYLAWQDYETGRTPEARFVNALDKIEPLFELFDPVNETSLKRLRFTYETHFRKKYSSAINFPVMRRFVEVMSADMLRRGVFWTPTEDDGA